MRGFSKAGKLFLAILLVITIAAVALLVSTLMKGDSPAIAIIAVVGSLGGLVMTYRTAVKERDAKEKEEAADNVEDETEDDNISEY